MTIFEVDRDEQPIVDLSMRYNVFVGDELVGTVAVSVAATMIMDHAGTKLHAAEEQIHAIAAKRGVGRDYGIHWAEFGMTQSYVEVIE